jgi:hypothetical protein
MKIADCVVYDFETARNRILLGFMDMNGAKLIIDCNGPISSEDRERIVTFVGERVLVGFNNLGFDTYLLWLMLECGAGPQEMFDFGQSIIGTKVPHWVVAKENKVRRSGFTEIDLLNYVKRAGLKAFEARLGMRHVKTLPFDVSTEITNDMVSSVIEYLEHDLAATKLLLESVWEEIEIRAGLKELFGLTGLLQKPPASAAEAVIVAEYCRAAGVDPEDVRAAARRFQNGFLEVQIEDWVKRVCAGTKAEKLIAAVDGVEFEFSDGKRGNPSRKIPDMLDIDGVRFAFGVGGLHSKDEMGILHGCEGLWDIDVASYYPSLMMLPGGAPWHLNAERFRGVFGGLLNRRLLAKAEGRKVEAGALKLIVNSAFGKMGDGRSALFSPGSFLNTTLGGQLALIALAEKISRGDAAPVSSIVSITKEAANG